MLVERNGTTIRLAMPCEVCGIAGLLRFDYSSIGNALVKSIVRGFLDPIPNATPTVLPEPPAIIYRCASCDEREKQ